VTLRRRLHCSTHTRARTRCLRLTPLRARHGDNAALCRIAMRYRRSSRWRATTARRLVWPTRCATSPPTTSSGRGSFRRALSPCSSRSLDPPGIVCL
jgi:hypothetical protein